ncbi:unnamed protein product [Cochlearia groenlandica]
MAHACDTCRTTTCTVYCHADSAYLCTSCDAQVHSANRVASRHKRVLVCESYQEGGKEGHEDAKEVTSWLFPNSDINSTTHNNNSQNNGLLFSDDYLDLVDYNSSMDYKLTGQYNQDQQDRNLQQISHGGDSVVPFQLLELTGHLRQNQHNFQFNNAYGSLGSHYSTHNGFKNHIAHNSSMEPDLVPQSRARVATASHPRPLKVIIEQLPGPPVQIITQLSALERKARVLRYREKKKKRRFEKTIRYASRKAYAERRPRVNGRFAKMIETEAEDQEFNNTMLMYNIGNGIVPSF